MPANNLKGFTLIEMVIGIIVFAVALVLFASLIVPQAKQSIDPIFQVRAAELAQSLINEIASKSFDENSNRVGGSFRCNELDDDDVLQACTISDDLGPEESGRDSFDDLDDYNGLTALDTNIKNALGNSITLNGNALYNGFSVAISVIYDDNMNGIDDAVDTGSSYTGNTKLITVTVTTPNDEDIIFSSYRSNF